jgi:hypothetical protein
MISHRQMSLFPNIVRKIRLVADSPRKAWWSLAIIEVYGSYFLIKKSGTKAGLLDTRKWPAKNYDKALKIFEKKVKLKTDPNRKKRVYKVAA